MFEKDAKQKWCSQVRLLAINRDGTLMSGSYNALADNRHPPGTDCIGKECAHWLPDGEDAGHCGLGGR